MLKKLEAYLQKNLLKLPKGLSAHLNRTSDLAIDLATTHKVSIFRCKLAALAHDFAKTYSNNELIKIVKINEIDCSEFELSNPEVLHGPVAAFQLHKYISDDFSMFNSIRWHTSGHKTFDKENQIVFLADKLEPYKINKRPELQYVHDLAFKDLENAVLAFFEIQFEFLKTKNIDIHPESIIYYDKLS